MCSVAEAHAVDSPSSGSSFVSMKFGSSSDHDGVTVAFVWVDEVLSGVLDFLDVYVGS